MEEIYNDNIELIGSPEFDKFRLPRLQRIIGFVQAKSEHYGNTTLLRKVSKLHDHKGTLTVFWIMKPSLGEEEFFKEAWCSIIGDGCDNILHEYNF